MTRTSAMKRTTFLLVAVLVSASEAAAYDNMKAHRAFNTVAMERFIAKAKADDNLAAFRMYEFYPDAGGKAFRYMTTNTTLLPEDVGAQTAFGWVVQGGFTADINYSGVEMAYRHFYDPLAMNNQSAWISDLADEWATTAKLQEFNPLITAKQWALGTGGPEKESRYSLRQFDVSMKSLLSTTAQRTRGADAWRCLGETLHLLADMTVPAHVRNDAHPGTPGGWSDVFAKWRSDPYENFVLDDTVHKYANNLVDPVTLAAIGMATTPEELFDILARYTNENFISQDTMSGVSPDGIAIRNRNGCAAYPSPKAAVEDYQGGYLVRQDYMGQVLLAGECWSQVTRPKQVGRLKPGPAPNVDQPVQWIGVPVEDKDGHPVMRYTGLQVTSACADSQARRLVPLTVAAEARLIEMVMPEMIVTLEGVDVSGGLASGTIKALKNLPAIKRVHMAFLANGRLGATSVDVDVAADGAFQAQLPPDLFPKGPNVGPSAFAVAVDLGGVLVKSNAIDVTPAVPASPASALEIAGPAVVTEGEIVQYSLRIPAGLAGRVAKVKWLTSMEAVPKFDEKRMAMMFPIRLKPTPAQADFAAPGEPMTYQGVTNTSFMHKYRPGASERTPVIGAIALDAGGKIVERINRPITLKVCPLFVKGFTPGAGWKLTAGETGLTFVKTVEGRRPPAGNDFAAQSFAHTVGAAGAEGKVWAQFRYFPDASRPETPEDLCKGQFRYVYNYGQLMPQSSPLDLSGWKGTLAELRTSKLPGPNGWQFSGTNQAGFAVLDHGAVRLQVGYLTTVSGAKVSQTAGSVDDTGWLAGTTAALRKEAIDLIQSIQIGK
ncbi:MAG: hypothetical protein NTV86_13560 [Planctomycetota bacterium]|nr:hypothetical protein [Planctomycetota bacterium]